MLTRMAVSLRRNLFSSKVRRCRLFWRCSLSAPPWLRPREMCTATEAISHAATPDTTEKIGSNETGIITISSEVRRNCSCRAIMPTKCMDQMVQQPSPKPA
eukprot:16443449-Heterocapsa_arctica.AAC.1